MSYPNNEHNLLEASDHIWDGKITSVNATASVAVMPYQWFQVIIFLSARLTLGAAFVLDLQINAQRLVRRRE